jgi:hypothetical protein
LYGQHRTTSYNDTVFPVESFAIPRSEPQWGPAKAAWLNQQMSWAWVHGLQIAPWIENRPL